MDTNTKEFAESIKNTMEGLVQIANSENKTKYAEEISRIKSFIAENPKFKLEENPENFSLFICFKNESIIKAVLDDMLPESKNKRAISFLYENYSFLDSHISSYIGDKIGRECCVDRSRYILRGFKNYLETGKKFTMDKDEYYICPFGTTEQWIAFVKALVNSFHHFPSEKELRIFAEMDLAAEKYLEKKEMEEAAYVKRLNSVSIDFRMIMDLKIPVLISNMDEGRLFSTLLDRFLADEENPNANLMKYFIESSTSIQVLTVSGGLIHLTNKDKWEGKEPIPFEKIAKES